MMRVSSAKNAFQLAMANPVTRKRLSLTTITCAVLLAALIATSEIGNDMYLVDESGHVIALYRENPSIPTEFVITLDVDGDDYGPREYRVVPAITGEKKEEKSDPDEQSKIIRDAEIGSILAEIENSQAKEITLPKALADGTELTWTKDSQNEYG